MSLKIAQKGISNRNKAFGLGVYTRQDMAVTIRAGHPGSGITLVTQDGDSIEASIGNACYGGNEQRTTVLENNGLRVLCVEHLLAAMYIRGVTSAEVLLEKKTDLCPDYEVPMFDGSLRYLLEMIDNAGVETILNGGSLAAMVSEAYRIVHPMIVEGENGRYIRAEPIHDFSANNHLQIRVTVNYNDSRIPGGTISLVLDRDLRNYAAESLSSARTFCTIEDIERLGEVDVVREAARYMIIAGTRKGFSSPDEPVMHKTVDFLGDMKLLGRPLIGKIETDMPGHRLNLEFARKVCEEAGRNNGKAELVPLY